MSGFKLSNGTDLDDIFEPIGSGTAQTTGFLNKDGTDLGSLYYNITGPGSLGNKADATGFKISNGNDLKDVLAKKGDVAKYKYPPDNFSNGYTQNVSGKNYGNGTYTISASAERNEPGTGTCAYAFNENGKFWQINPYVTKKFNLITTGTTTEEYTGDWVKITYNTYINVKSYSITTMSVNNPKKWALGGSPDGGITWYKLHDRNGDVGNLETDKIYSYNVLNPSNYNSFIFIYIASDGDYPTLRGLKFYSSNAEFSNPVSSYSYLGNTLTYFATNSHVILKIIGSNETGNINVSKNITVSIFLCSAGGGGGAAGGGLEYFSDGQYGGSSAYYLNTSYNLTSGNHNISLQGSKSGGIYNKYDDTGDGKSGDISTFDTISIEGGRGGYNSGRSAVSGQGGSASGDYYTSGINAHGPSGTTKGSDIYDNPPGPYYRTVTIGGYTFNCCGVRGAKGSGSQNFGGGGNWGHWSDDQNEWNGQPGGQGVLLIAFQFP